MDSTHSSVFASDISRNLKLLEKTTPEKLVALSEVFVNDITRCSLSFDLPTLAKNHIVLNFN